MARLFFLKKAYVIFTFQLYVGGFLLGRTLAAVLTVTLSTSMAARQGALSMAAHQICLQVWLSASLLVDAQAAAGQVKTNYV